MEETVLRPLSQKFQPTQNVEAGLSEPNADPKTEAQLEGSISTSIANFDSDPDSNSNLKDWR